MKSVSGNTLFVNILKLISGEGIGRAIGFVTAPLITRLYTPSDFGILAVFTSLCVLCYPFCTLKYTLAIPLNSNERIGINLVAACLLILVVNTSVISVAFVLFHSPILSFFSSESIEDYWYFIPVAFFINGAAEILSYYSIRYRDFSIIAKVAVVQKAIGAMVKIVLGLFRANPTGLLIGTILAESGGFALYISSGWKRLSEIVPNVTLQKIRFVLKRYKSFPLYRVPSQILLKAAISIPILYFAWHFGAGAAGQISLAIAILSVPVAIVCPSVGRAFYGEIASLGRKNGKDISVLTLRVMIKLCVLGIIPFTLVICLGPRIFGTIFGPEWSQAGIYARYLCVYQIFRFVYSPISDGIFNLFERQRLVFGLEVSRILIILSSIFISYVCKCAVTCTIAIYSVALTAQYIFSIIFVFYILRKTI